MLKTYAILSVLAGAFCAASPTLGALAPQSLSRVPLRHFVADGVFEGGGRESMNLDKIYLSETGETEKWTIDFGALDRQIAPLNPPHFVLRYLKGETLQSSDGTPLYEKPSRFILQLEKIHRNRVSHDALLNEIRKSRLVKEITIYPQVEHGDLAIELVLRKGVKFEPHQPLGQGGRLVLEMKH